MSDVEEKIIIYIQEDIDVAKRSWLSASLEHYKGIISAIFDHGDHHRLSICYERKHFSHITLMDTINEHGYHGKIIDN